MLRDYLSVFSPNAEKYGPEKTPYLGTFHAVDDRRSLAINNFQEQSPKVPLELKFYENEGKIVCLIYSPAGTYSF